MYATGTPQGAASQHPWGPYVVVSVIVLSNIVCYLLNDNSFLGRRLWKRRGKSIFFASNCVKPSTDEGKSRPEEFWAFDVLDPECMVTSYFVKDWALLAVHALAFVWLPICAAIEQTLTAPMRHRWVAYFTNWSLMQLCIVGLLGLGTQARYMWRRRRSRITVAVQVPVAESVRADVTTIVPSVDVEAAKREVALVIQGDTRLVKWDWLTISYVINLETLATTNLFLVVVWVALVLAQGYDITYPVGYFKHGPTVGIIFLEVFLTRAPVVSFHVLVAINFLTGYAVMLWIYGEVANRWMYGLCWYKVSAVIETCAIPAGLCIFMLLWWGVAVFREKVGPAYGAWRERRMGTRSSAAPLVDMAEAPSKVVQA